tara:strand:- start:263 stop:850 length:588 start_codon:yes stop_codon:yes gene_type:complete
MKHLIVVTRSNAASRPSEAVIESDSDNVLLGQATEQTPTEDNFFVVEGDITKNAVRLLSTNDINPYGKDALDGAAFYRYPHDRKTTGATELRTWETVDLEDNPITITAKAHVQYTASNSSGTMIYDTLEEAANFIGTLHASDGYVLLDEAQNTQVIQTRPSLWESDDEIMMGVPCDVDLSVKVAYPSRQGEADRY